MKKNNCNCPLLGSNKSLLNIFKITRQLERYCIPISAMDACKPEMRHLIIMNFYQQNSAWENFFYCEAFLESRLFKVTMLIPASHMNILKAHDICGSWAKGKKKRSRIKWKTKRAFSQKSFKRGALCHFHMNWYVFDVFLLL